MEALYESKGFKSWEDWRRNTHKNILGKDIDWNLYEIEKPEETVSEFIGGPFISWRKWFYMGNNKPTLKEIVKHPGIQNHYYILDIAKNLNRDTILSGIIKDENIYIVEGMHRACALALRKQWAQPVKSKVFIALGEWGEELPTLGSEGLRVN